MVDLLIVYGADVNISDYYHRTSLIFAARSDDKKISRTLIQHGADVNCQDHRGMTPLHHAAALNLTSMARLLLDHGARGDILEDNGKSPIDLTDSDEMRKILSTWKADHDIPRLKSELIEENIKSQPNR